VQDDEQEKKVGQVKISENEKKASNSDYD